MSTRNLSFIFLLPSPRTIYVQKHPIPTPYGYKTPKILPINYLDYAIQYEGCKEINCYVIKPTYHTSILLSYFENNLCVSSVATPVTNNVQRGPCPALAVQ